MTFDEALKILNIEDYKERIWNSNSHGELFHILDYMTIAEAIIDDPKWFREWFEHVVKAANDSWERPESVYQHIIKILNS